MLKKQVRVVCGDKRAYPQLKGQSEAEGQRQQHSTLAPKCYSEQQQINRSGVDFIAHSHTSLQQHHCFCGDGENVATRGWGGGGYL